MKQAPQDQQEFYFVFGVQLGLRHILALTITYHIIIINIFCSFSSSSCLLFSVLFFMFWLPLSFNHCLSVSMQSRTPKTKHNAPCLCAIWFHLCWSTRLSIEQKVPQLPHKTVYTVLRVSRENFLNIDNRVKKQNVTERPVHCGCLNLFWCTHSACGTYRQFLQPTKSYFDNLWQGRL